MIDPCHLSAAERCERPPVFIRLTKQALDSIALKRPMQVSLVAGQAKLTVGTEEFSGILLPDPGAVELFVRDKAGYKSGGKISNRFVLNEAKPAPAASAAAPPRAGSRAPSKPDQRPEPPQSKPIAKPQPRASTPAAKPAPKLSPKPSPKHRPLVHHAALGQVSPAQLAGRTSASIEECRDFLVEFATPVDEGRRGAGDPFRLKDETFLYVRPWEFQYSEEDRRTVIELCKKALDNQEIGPEHPARKGLKAPKAPAKAVRTSSQSSQKSVSTPQSAPSSAPSSARGSSTITLPKEPIKKRKKEPSPEASRPSERKASTPPERIERTERTLKRKSAVAAASPSKRKKDVAVLVKKFRALYDEYSRLYKALERLEKRPPSEVEKLLSMHKDLAEWKSSIWAASDDSTEQKSR